MISCICAIASIQKTLYFQNQVESTARCRIIGPCFASYIKSFDCNPVHSLKISSNITDPNKQYLPFHLNTNIHHIILRSS